MNTHGEWKWRQRGESLVLEGANRFRVLSIERGVIPTNSDSRLIAESPALLFELQRVVSWFEQYQEAQRNGGNLVELLQNVDLSDAKAAIAKAKGQK